MVVNFFYGFDNFIGMSGVCVIVNLLCNLVCIFLGVDFVLVIENFLYEVIFCIEGIMGEVNYGENVDEDGSEESFLG